MQAVGTWAAPGRRVGRLLWCAFLTFGAVLNVWFSRPRDLPESLRSFVAAGQAARDGLNPYGLYPLVWHLVMPDGSMAWGVNLNPPLSVLLFRPLAGMNVARLGLVFYFGGLALYLLPAIIAATGTWALLLLLADVVWGARGVVQGADVAPAPRSAETLSALDAMPVPDSLGARA